MSRAVMFSQSTIEAIGYYVYCLYDPQTNKIFYIGKGKGNRVFQHIQDALDVATETDKLNTIRNILNKGQQVGYYILRHGLTEEESFIVESVLIDFLTFKNFEQCSSITNIVAGHEMINKGIKTAEEVESLYSAISINQEDIKHKVIIININKTYKIGVLPYEATRKSWKISLKRAEKVEFVFSEYKGIIRRIYKPERWLQDNSYTTKRYMFEGTEVVDKEIVNLYLNKHFSGKKKGQVNPIMYVG